MRYTSHSVAVCSVTVADRVHGPRFGAIREELMPVALLPLQPVVDRALDAIDAGRVRRYLGGAPAMPASCSKLQCVSAAMWPDGPRVGGQRGSIDVEPVDDTTSTGSLVDQ